MHIRCFHYRKMKNGQELRSRSFNGGIVKLGSYVLCDDNIYQDIYSWYSSLPVATDGIVYTITF